MPETYESHLRAAPESLFAYSGSRETALIGNPVLEWCIGNADRHGNVYPTRRWPEQKIDAAIALFMAVDQAMPDDEDAASMDWFSVRSYVRDSPYGVRP